MQRKHNHIELLYPYNSYGNVVTKFMENSKSFFLFLNLVCMILRRALSIKVTVKIV